MKSGQKSKPTVYQVNIDPSNNIFYASKPGDCAGYNQFKLQMTSNPAFVKDQSDVKAPTTKNEQINRIQKKRRIQAMQFGAGSQASQNSNYTFEQPSIKSLKSTPLDTEVESSMRQSCVSPSEQHSSLKANNRVKRAEASGAIKNKQSTGVVEEYNQFFKAVIKMSGIKVND